MPQLTPAPTSRQKWLAERRKRLGATDVSAILGLNPYRTSYEVWLDKMDMVEEWNGNDATSLGHMLEPAILDEAERRWGTLERQVVAADPDSKIAATLDGWLPNRNEVVEVKTAGLTNEFAELGHWGEPLTDQIPQWYLVQLQVQLLCTGGELARMLALISGRGLVEYQVKPDEQVAAMIRDTCSHWWYLHVEKKLQPPITVAPNIEVLKRIRREPDSVKVCTAEVMDAVAVWEQLNQRATKAKKAADAAKAKLIAELGTNEAGLLPDGRLLTYAESERKGYVVEPSKYRTLRVKKPGKS